MTEFELVTQALWTDPGDQSGWIYHRWLIGTSSSSTWSHVNRELISDPPDRVLRREINNIRELHDTEPDSKCTPYPSTTWPCDWCLGCMNALANYLILQSRLPSTDKFKGTRQREEARSLFGRLEEIDPDRRERYKDLASACWPCITSTIYCICMYRSNFKWLHKHGSGSQSTADAPDYAASGFLPMTPRPNAPATTPNPSSASWTSARNRSCRSANFVWLRLTSRMMECWRAQRTHSGSESDKHLELAFTIQR